MEGIVMGQNLLPDLRDFQDARTDPELGAYRQLIQGNSFGYQIFCEIPWAGEKPGNLIESVNAFAHQNADLPDRSGMSIS
jgi:hypothetical protein